MPHRERQSRRLVICDDCVRCESSHRRGRHSQLCASSTRREQQERRYRDDQPGRHQPRYQGDGRESLVGLIGIFCKAAFGTVFGHETTGRPRHRSRSRSRTASPSRHYAQRRDHGLDRTAYYRRAPEQYDGRSHRRHSRPHSRESGRRAAAEDLRTHGRYPWAHPPEDYYSGSRSRRPRSPSPRRPQLTVPVYSRRSARTVVQPVPPSSSSLSPRTPSARQPAPRKPSPRRLLPAAPAKSQPAVVDRRASVVDVPDDPEDTAQDSAGSPTRAKKHVKFGPSVMEPVPS
ncbi:hypothetical protein RB596_007110 [Gaeumannomyces avenae]